MCTFRYYEWLKKGKERLPYFTRPKDNNKLMLLAGLWDCTILEGPLASRLTNSLTHMRSRNADEKEPLWTFTIVTTDANKDFTWLHDRQPVILSSKAAVDAWLDTSSQQWTSALTSLVRPYTDATALLEWYNPRMIQVNVP